MVHPRLIATCRHGVMSLLDGSLNRPDDIDYVLGRIDGVFSMCDGTPENYTFKMEVAKELATIKAERVRNGY